MRDRGGKRFSNGCILFRTGVFLFLLLVLVSIFASSLSPNDPLAVDLSKRFQGPTDSYPLGTDHLGRCILSRLLYGSQLSFVIALTVLAFAVTFGSLIGVIAGLTGGFIESSLMKVVDIFLAFPGLVFTLALTGIIGPGSASIIIGISSVWWVSYARLVRGLMIAAKEKEFILSAHAIGAGFFRILFLYIIPQILPSLVVFMTLDAGWIILGLSGLNFLGLGIQPPNPEWGAMLNEARPFFHTNPGLILFPGCAIALTVLGLNLLGEGLRDKLQVEESATWR
jgi:ABC-type dipeptide/oligopeptide/nickel transport system permease subunit